MQPEKINHRAINDLQEYMQKRSLALPSYDPIRCGGTDHQPLWISQVTLHDGTKHTGSACLSKKLAKCSAATKALQCVSRDVKTHAQDIIQDQTVPLAQKKLSQTHQMHTSDEQPVSLIQEELFVIPQTEIIPSVMKQPPSSPQKHAEQRFIHILSNPPYQIIEKIACHYKKYVNCEHLTSIQIKNAIVTFLVDGYTDDTEFYDAMLIINNGWINHDLFNERARSIIIKLAEDDSYKQLMGTAFQYYQ